LTVFSDHSANDLLFGTTMYIVRTLPTAIIWRVAFGTKGGRGSSTHCLLPSFSKWDCSPNCTFQQIAYTPLLMKHYSLTQQNVPR